MKPNTEEGTFVSGRDLRVGDVIETWWKPNRDTITKLEPYTGTLRHVFTGGARCASFSVNKTGLTIENNGRYWVFERQPVAEPPQTVAYRYRFYDTVNTPENGGGWCDWVQCDEAKYREILAYIDSGYKYQAEELAVAKSTSWEQASANKN